MACVKDEASNKDGIKNAVTAAAVIGASVVGGYFLKKFGGIETSGVKICSFNLWNLQSHVVGKDSDPKFRTQRIKKVADLIARNLFSVVVLQEVKTPETVNDICRLINESAGFGRYNGVHCSNAYAEIFGDGKYSGKTNTTLKRAELAYIWDTRVFEPACDDFAKVVYTGIDNSINHLYDVFFVSAAALIVGGMRYLNKKKAGKKRIKREAVIDGSAFTAAGLAIDANNHSASKVVEWGVRETQEWLRQNLRPPFVLLLNFRNDKKKQLRLINVHLQFGLTATDQEDCRKGESQAAHELRIRQQEVRLIAQNKGTNGKSKECIFDIVNSQRSGGHETALTIIAGDFNLSIEQIQKDADGVANVANDMVVAQSKNSSISLKAAADTKEHKKVWCQAVNSYDHFLFKSDVWSAGNAKVLDSPDPLIDDGFYAEKVVKGKTVLHPISDHLPVVITSTKI